MATLTIKDLLLEHHLAMQTERQRRITEKEFAAIIGIDDKYYNHIYNGRRNPSAKVVKLFADFFEDPRFYDAVDMERPDQMLDNVNRNWWKLSSRTKTKIDKLVAAENEPITQTRKKTASPKA